MDSNYFSVDFDTVALPHKTCIPQQVNCILQQCFLFNVKEVII